MPDFSDLARRAIDRASRALAKSERAGRGPQPVEMIPGMTAAQEPCLLPAIEHWTRELQNGHDVAQAKMDGMRAHFIGSPIGPRIVTREAGPLNAALHCLPALHRLEQRFGEPMFFDGEYQARDGYEATMREHKLGEGAGVFWLFDAVPYSEWAANRFVQPLQARLERVAALMPTDEPFLSWLAPQRFYSRDVAELAASAWAAGAEGLVIKRSRDPYHRGRSTSWLKLKREITVDGPVVDVVMKGDDPSTIVALVRIGKTIIRVPNMPKHCRELALTDVMIGNGEGLTDRMVECTYERTDKGSVRNAKIIRLRPDKEA